MAYDREHWKIWSARVLLVCAAILCAWSLTYYLENVVRFRDVESWPTVAARDVSVVPKQIRITTPGRYGSAEFSFRSIWFFRCS